MSLEAGNYYELSILESNWINAKSLFANAGHGLTPRLLETTAGKMCEVDIAYPHWAILKAILDANRVPHAYLDRGAAQPRWIDVTF